MSLKIFFNFSDLNGSELVLFHNPDSIQEDYVGRVIIEPLRKIALTNEVSLNNFAASDWPVWENPRDPLDTPNNYIQLKITGLEYEGILNKFKFRSLSFSLMRDATGPRHWQWRTNVNNYEEPIFVRGAPVDERGVQHDNGIITLPPEPPTDPPFFGPFFIDFEEIQQEQEQFKFGFDELEMRLYGYYLS